MSRRDVSGRNVTSESMARSTRLRSQLTRLAAGILLAAVCVGIPVWLIAIGGVPFAHVDPFALVRAVTDRHGTDTRAVGSWLGQVGLVIAWAAWSWTVTCIVLEARYWLSGRSPANLPASRTVQWAIACLVSTAFALGGAGRPGAHYLPAGPAGAPATQSVPVVRVVSDQTVSTGPIVAFIDEPSGRRGVPTRLAERAATNPSDRLDSTRLTRLTRPTRSIRPLPQHLRAGPAPHCWSLPTR